MGGSVTPGPSFSTTSGLSPASCWKGCGSGWQAASPSSSTKAARSEEGGQNRIASGKRDGRDHAAVIGAAGEAGAAIAEEALGLRGGIVAGAADAGKAELGETRLEIAREIEQRVAR